MEPGPRRDWASAFLVLQRRLAEDRAALLVTADRSNRQGQGLLPGAVTLAGDDVGTGSVLLGDRFDERRAVVDEPDAVVGAVGLGKDPVADEPVHHRPAPRLGVVVDTVAVGEQRQPVGDGPQLGPEGVGGAAAVPADGPGGDR